MLNCIVNYFVKCKNIISNDKYLFLYLFNNFIKMKTTLLFLLLSFTTHAQTHYNLSIVSSGNPKPIPVGLSAGYNYKWLSTDAGMLTNWNEYYTLFYAAVGAHTTGKIFIEGMFGAGYTSSIPTNKNYDVGKFTGYLSGKVGYCMNVGDGVVIPYAGIARAYNTWVSFGVVLTSR